MCPSPSLSPSPSLLPTLSLSPSLSSLSLSLPSPPPCLKTIIFLEKIKDFNSLRKRKESRRKPEFGWAGTSIHSKYTIPHPHPMGVSSSATSRLFLVLSAPSAWISHSRIIPHVPKPSSHFPGPYIPFLPSVHWTYPGDDGKSVSCNHQVQGQHLHRRISAVSHSADHRTRAPHTLSDH